jgi:parvulin-like peptidyl-prolyl isomerase
LTTQANPALLTEDEAGEQLDVGLESLIQQLQLQLSSLERQLSPDLAPIFGGQVLDRMIEEALVRQEAAQRGLAVSDERMREEIGVLLGINTAAPPDEIDTTADDLATGVGMEDFDEIYAQFKTNVLQTSRFAEKDFRNMVRASVLRDQLRAELAEGVELEQEQVEAVLFSLETEETAEATRARLVDDEEDPEDLVEEFATDEDPGTAAFSLPWLPTGYLAAQLGIEIERAAFNTPVGDTSPIVLGQDGRFYIVYVGGREVRELSEEFAAQSGDQAYESWLAQAKSEHAEYLNWQAALVTR